MVTDYRIIYNRRNTFKKGRKRVKPIAAPLYQRLVERQAAQPVRLHVPGHQYGDLQGEPYELFRKIMSIDVTELADTDDLHHPEDVILEAQKLAAACFGADTTYFLVGGSTVGNQAMLLAACNPGDAVIVQRNVHKSVLNGIALAGAQAVFVSPQIDGMTGIATMPAQHDIAAAFARYPEAKALFLSTPNYYGMHTAIDSYADTAHGYGALLLVDEAHGAHFGLHPAFPASAIQSGADAVVQSTHKTLTALTMGAMLHVREGRMPVDRLRRALSILQSSSPSYPIMASLDISRAMVDAWGPAWFNKGMLAADKLRKLFSADARPLAVVTRNERSAYDALDPMRVVIYDRTGAIPGYRLLELLSNEGCWAEMADDRHVVLLFGPGAAEESADQAADALDRIEREYCREMPVEAVDPVHVGMYDHADDPVSEPVRLRLMPPDDSETERIALSEAEGRIAAETVLPYPPGIPMLYAGEPIRARHLAAIRRLADHGAKFQGANDARMLTIRVLR